AREARTHELVGAEVQVTRVDLRHLPRVRNHAQNPWVGRAAVLVRHGESRAARVDLDEPVALRKLRLQLDLVLPHFLEQLAHDLSPGGGLRSLERPAACERVGPSEGLPKATNALRSLRLEREWR